MGDILFYLTFKITAFTTAVVKADLRRRYEKWIYCIWLKEVEKRRIGARTNNGYQGTKGK